MFPSSCGGLLHKNAQTKQSDSTCAVQKRPRSYLQEIPDFAHLLGASHPLHRRGLVTGSLHAAAGPRLPSGSVLDVVGVLLPRRVLGSAPALIWKAVSEFGSPFFETLKRSAK